MITAGVVLGMAAGCSAAHEPEEHYDGRRLRVVMDRPESGEPTFAGFFDPDLDVLCEPRVTEDGVLRCVPSLRNTPTENRRYVNSDCTESIDTTPPEPHLFRYFVETAHRELCPTSSYVRVFEISEEMETFPATYHRSAVTGACERSVVIPDPTTGRRLTPIPPRRMVRGTLEPGSGPDRLVRDDVAWADGTRGFAQIRDTERGEPCTIRAASRNPMSRAVCVPTPRAYALTGRSDCRERWMAAINRECTLSPDDVIVSFDCDSVSVERVGDVVPEADRVTTPGCHLRYENQTVYSSSPAPHGLVPSLRPELRGEGRLRRRVWIDEDGGEWSDTRRYYDSELGVDCQTASWTAERCLPSPSLTQQGDDRTFADERCTEPAARQYETGCRPDEYVWRESCQRASGTICPPASGPPELYRWGEPLDGPVYARDEATGACMPLPPRDGAHAFRLERADLDELALVRRVLE